MVFKKEKKIPWNKGMKDFIHSGSFKKGHSQSNTGRTHFKKGMTSWCKGTKGIMQPNQTSFKKGERISPKTEFKKGQTPWNKKHPEEKIIKSYLDGEKLINISNKFGGGIRVIHQILKRKNIDLRSRPKGENHFNWKGGISREPYTFDFKRISKRTRERDNNTCQLCGDLVLKQTRKKFLTTHHIDYNKKNNSEYNLIALCNFCNSSVNFSRKQWIEHFNKRVTILGGKECSA